MVVVHINSIAQTLSESDFNNSVYGREFNELKNNQYNKFLISKSVIKPDLHWDNYKGGKINTADSLFYFNNDQLCFSFPTNSNKFNNQFIIHYFSKKSAKCPTLFSLLKYYQPVIDSNLKKNDLPIELRLLPVVLSSFNPFSNNGLGGEGFWHLNYVQAIKYGLTINKYIDERRDFNKSTSAATAYLKDLHKIYNSWELTLTAYSSGVVTVNKLLNRHSAKTYKEIYPYLPNETKNLVQAFVSMQYIYNYDDYGAVNLNPIIEVDTVFIKRKLMFEALNHVLNTKTEDFNFYNLTLIGSVFPDNYKACFPRGTKEKFIEMEDSIYYYQDSVILAPKKEPKIIIPKEGEPFIYIVKSGDVLGLLAERFNVRVSQIQEWNDLDGTRINLGQKLTIYGKNNNESPQKNTQKDDTSTEKKPTEKIPSDNSKEYNTYTVKSGDNLWLIAKKYSGVSAQNIMDFNGIDENLNIGQVLKIPKK